MQNLVLGANLPIWVSSEPRLDLQTHTAGSADPVEKKKFEKKKIIIVVVIIIVNKFFLKNITI